MRRAELRTGMRVTCENGRIGTVALGHERGDTIVYNNNSYIDFCDFREDLAHSKGVGIQTVYDKAWDIIEVSKPRDQLKLFVPSADFTVIYTREEPVKEYTVEQIEAIVGHKVKIVGGN